MCVLGYYLICMKHLTSLRLQRSTLRPNNIVCNNFCNFYIFNVINNCLVKCIDKTKISRKVSSITEGSLRLKI